MLPKVPGSDERDSRYYVRICGAHDEDRGMRELGILRKVADYHETCRKVIIYYCDRVVASLAMRVFCMLVDSGSL